MPKQYKIDKVSDLKQYFESNKNYIFTDFKGLTVEKFSAIRAELRKFNSKLVVMKNTYARIIAKEKKLPNVDQFTTGATAIAFGNEDINEVVKKLFEFGKESPIKVKGGFAEELLMDGKQLEAFSKLPGKKQLLSMVMATMNAPVQNFAYACNDSICRFVRVVNAVAEKKKSEGAA
jgi:large subunit ribosomal protein L10